MTPPYRVSRFGEYRGYTQPVYDGWRRFSQYVTTRDGTKIAIDFNRPTRRGKLHEEPLPVIWTHTQYKRAMLTDSGLYTVMDYVPQMQAVLQHGYVVAIADVRGTGASFGSRFGVFPPEEARDAFDIIEWFAMQPWCTGSVGMFWASYMGETQYFAASEEPAHLKAIFAEMAWFDEYDSFPYPGGIPALIRSRGTNIAALPLSWKQILETNKSRSVDLSPYRDCNTWWCAPVGGRGRDPRAFVGTATTDERPAEPVAPVDEDVDGSMLAASLADHRASTMSGVWEAVPFRDSIHPGRFTPFHEERSLYPRLESIRRSNVPAYHLGGWLDALTCQTALWFRNYPNPQRMTIGNWFHTDRDTQLVAAEYRRWFDYWLKGIDNGVMEEPPVHYWTIGAERGREWRAADHWPLATERRVDYFFRRGRSGSIDSSNDGVLALDPSNDGEKPDVYPVDYSTSVGLDNRWTNVNGTGAGREQYADIKENDRKGLTYTTPPLETELEITGHPVVHLWIASTANDGDFFAYLNRVSPDGTSTYLSEGQLRASHRKLAESPYDRMGLPYHRSFAQDVETIAPGEVAELVFDLQPVSVLVPAADRVRVTVTCADRDTFATPVLSPPPTVSVFCDGQHRSRITLPTISGASK
jgi:uncharacterized protein